MVSLKTSNGARRAEYVGMKNECYGIIMGEALLVSMRLSRHIPERTKDDIDLFYHRTHSNNNKVV